MKIYNNELITVVIPVYNVEKYLRKCVESVMNQTYKNLEIILVNDGSTDNCDEICQEYRDRDKRIKLINKENGGLSEARNVGINHSKGKYISFIDSDDYVDKEYIELLYNIITLYDADISISSHRVIYEKKCMDKSNGKEFCANPEIILEKILYDDGIDLSTWGKLYKKDLFESIRFPKGRLFEDSATTYKLIDKSKKIAVCSKATYNYIIRKNSISNEKFSERKMDLIISTKEMTDFIRNKYTRLQSACDRRLMYSYLSTLTQLSKSNVKNKKIEKELMKYINENRIKILKDRKVPKRDKFGLITTMFGFNCFKYGWRIYSTITGRV